MLIADHMAVSKLDVSARVVCNVGVVRHENDSPTLGMQLLKEHEDFETRPCIEVTGGFIGQYNGGIVN